MRKVTGHSYKICYRTVQSLIVDVFCYSNDSEKKDEIAQNVYFLFRFDYNRIYYNDSYTAILML